VAGTSDRETIDAVLSYVAEDVVLGIEDCDGCALARIPEDSRSYAYYALTDAFEHGELVGQLSIGFGPDAMVGCHIQEALEAEGYETAWEGDAWLPIAVTAPSLDRLAATW